MGFAGFKGQIYYTDYGVPTLECSTSNAPSWSGGTCYEDEITSFTVDDEVDVDRYGSDKSNGWKHAVFGTRGLTISLDAKICSIVVASRGAWYPLPPGKKVLLALYPAGDCETNTPAVGYAGIQRISYRIDQDTGKALGYTATLLSDGEWTGVPTAVDDNGMAAWGGFETECQTGL